MSVGTLRAERSSTAGESQGETSRRQAPRRAADTDGACARNPLAADAPVPPWTLENGAV